MTESSYEHCDFTRFFFRLTDTSEEDRAKQPMTETEMLQMPKYVAENRRCACPEDDCNYVTVDTFMLVSFLINEIGYILEN